MKLLFDGCHVNDGIICAHFFHVRHRGVFLAFEECIDLFERLAFRLNPEDPLFKD